jgi:hypothetical protein
MKQSIKNLANEILTLKIKTKELEEQLRKEVTDDYNTLVEAKDHNGLMQYADDLHGASVAQFFYSAAYNIRHRRITTTSSKQQIYESNT